MFHQLTEVSKQYLVYFTIDETTAVLPTKMIIMVEGAKPIAKGEKVMVTWNGKGCEAYILELSGKRVISYFNLQSFFVETFDSESEVYSANRTIVLCNYI